MSGKLILSNNNNNIKAFETVGVSVAEKYDT